MSIIQISKIQQRSGNLVDLPQLDEAEFGWASDAKRLFIGKTTPNENVEVLTSYSQINYSQINGSVGNLNISNVTVADGQVLTYDGSNWVNRGGDAGGLITLGNVSNVKITGGAIGYVLETDGLGNLSWTPKATIVAYIQNVTQANPAVVTTDVDNFFADGMEITITNASGMTQLNGNTYYANVLTSNTFSLYSDPSLTTTVNSTGYGEYSYTTATSTSASTNRVTVGNSALFNLNQEVLFLGDLSTSGLENNVPYYIKTKPSGTTITVSEELLANGAAGNTKILATATLTGSNVYATGGRVISSVSSGGGTAAAGSNATVQFNNSNLLDGDADFTWNFGVSPKVLGIVGNANVGNLNASGLVTASLFTSNIATGTAPLTVTSTTRVSNLNVAYSNVSDFGVVTAQTTGTFYPVFVNSSSTGNRALAANANLSFNAATGALSATLLTGTLTTAAQPNITSVGTLSNLTVTGNVNSGNVVSGTVSATLLSGTLTTAAQPNITSVGTLSSLTVSGNAFLSTSSGNVGIGTSTPQQKLHVAGGTIGAYSNTNSNANNTIGSSLYLGDLPFNSASYYNSAPGISAVYSPTTQVAGDLAFYVYTQNVNSRTERMRILSSGNVGIGNTAPTHTLSVTGTMNVSGNANVGNLGATGVVATTLGGSLTTAAQPNITSVGTLTSLSVTGNISSGNISTSTVTAGLGSASTPSYTFSGDTNTGIFSPSSDAIAFTTGATERMRIRNTGNVGVNVDPAVRFHVRGTSSDTIQTVARFDANNVANDDTHGLYLAVDAITNIVEFSSTGTNNGLFVFKNGSTENMRLSAGGNLGIGNSAPTDRLSVTGNAVISGNVSASRLISNIATGTAPLTVTSTTQVANLNAATAGTAGTVTTNAQPNITSVGTLTSLSVTGNITSGNVYANTGTIGSGTILTPALTTGANTTPGTITGNWTLTAGSQLQSTYADLAEYYEADDIYAPGTVLMFGGEKEVTLATDGTPRVAGVVSSNPAYVMNATCPGILTAVALQGRVPCKVRGKISKGDMLISGGNGYARPNQFPTIGTVIGKALQDFDGYEGVIEVAVGRL